MAGVRLDGQTVIVTGAGGGLGRAYALMMAARGAQVVVNDVVADAADEVVAEIEKGGGIAASSYDSVATPEGGAAITQRALERFGTVHGVVNNAGSMRNGYFEQLTPPDIREVLAVHLEGAFYVTQPAWRVMKSRGYGRIVLTSSSSGAFGHQGVANYAAAKAGLLGLGRALAYEGAGHGIIVNCVLPQAATGIQSATPIPDMEANAAPYRPEGSAPFLSSGRRSPEIAGALVVYLLSDQCAITGEAFSSGLARFGRVFTGVTRGWLSADGSVGPEDIATHLDLVRALDEFDVPNNLFEERQAVLRRLIAASPRR